MSAGASFVARIGTRLAGGRDARVGPRRALRRGKRNRASWFSVWQREIPICRTCHVRVAERQDGARRQRARTQDFRAAGGVGYLEKVLRVAAFNREYDVLGGLGADVVIGVVGERVDGEGAGAERGVELLDGGVAHDKIKHHRARAKEQEDGEENLASELVAD